MLFEKEALDNNFASRYEFGINFCISHNFLRIFYFVMSLMLVSITDFLLLMLHALNLHKI